MATSETTRKHARTEIPRDRAFAEHSAIVKQQRGGSDYAPPILRKIRNSIPRQRTHRTPLFDIVQIRRVTASIHLEESTAAQYAAFLHASADEVVDKALAYVFAKDRDFQEFLRTPEAARVPASLRIRMVPQTNGAAEPVNGSAKPTKTTEAGNDLRSRS
jgi:hypothetical protein